MARPSKKSASKAAKYWKDGTKDERSLAGVVERIRPKTKARKKASRKTTRRKATRKSSRR